eukprot:3228187-Pyramimonas_sp.AAC.1
MAHEDIIAGTLRPTPTFTLQGTRSESRFQPTPVTARSTWHNPLPYVHRPLAVPSDSRKFS